MFYESTLGLQSNFEPAKQRLISIQCMRILKNPQYFKQEKSAKPNDWQLEYNSSVLQILLFYNYM